jgi:stage II sporulation protein P
MRFLVSVLCILTSCFCFTIRAPKILSILDIDFSLVAALTTFPNGIMFAENSKNKAALKKENSDNKPKSASSYNETNHNEKKDAELGSESALEEPDSPEEIKRHENEKTYKVIETQFGEGGIKFENFYVKNHTKIDLDIAKELGTPLDISIKKDGKPEVLIYHTHTTEAYTDKDRGFIYSSYSSRTTDNRFNVTRVGEEIKEVLESYDISVIHDKTVHDNPSYKGSYWRSLSTIKKNLEKYPSIQVLLDIHRDSVGEKETGKSKLVSMLNGEKVAQIMILAGCDSGNNDFPNWRKNLRLALRLQRSTENLCSGMARPLKFDEMELNMSAHPGSLLIEVGTDVNTIKEACLAGKMLGKSLASVLEDLTKFD